jgi:hypothetical protein
MSEASEQAADVRALGEAIRETSAALGRMEQASGQTRDAINGLGSRVSAARSTVMEVVGAVGEFVGAMQDAAVEVARQSRALQLLGSDFQAVEAQTLGVVSAQEALSTRGRLLASGLQVTGEQLGLITRAAREYALATGGEVSQAMDQLTDAVGEASEDAMRKFNLRLQEGLGRQDQFNASLDQLRQRFAGVAPPALAADERVEAFNRTATETKNLLLAELSSAANSFAQTLFQIGGGSDSATETLRQFNRELRDAGGLFSLGPNNVEQANARARQQMAEVERISREFVVQRTAFENSEVMRAAGFRLRATRELDSEQRRLMVALFAESDRLSAQDFVRRANEIQQLAERRREAARQSADLARLQAAADAEGARDRAAHARDELGMAIRVAAQAGQRNYLTQQAVTPMQRLAYLQRELGRLSQNETANREQILTTLQGITQLRQQQQQEAQQASQAAQQRAQEAQRRLDAERELRNIQATMAAEGAIEVRLEQRRFESILDFRARELEASRRSLEAIRAQRTAENEAFQRFLDEQRQRLQLERETQQAKEAAAQAERDRAKEQAGQDELAARLRGAFGMAETEVETANQRLASAAKIGADTIGELFSGSLQAAVDAAKGGEDAAAAVAKYVDEWTASKALQWGLQALEAVAGAGVAYFIRPDAVPGLLASAATYAGLAATAGAVTAAIPNAPAAGAGGPPEGGAGGERMAGSTRSATAAEAGPVAPIVFNVSGFTSTESAQEGIVRALREAQARGLIEMGR